MSELDVDRLEHERRRMTTFRSAPEGDYLTIPFALELAAQLTGRENAEAVAKAICCNW